jgi:uncharacterized membrane protein YphA (DoxX/SURF4 family)/uncharacterized membrane protein
MKDALASSPATLVLLAIPREVMWAYFATGAVFVIGLAAIFARSEWQKARGFDTLILFGPVFYAAPLAAFGTEHFTLTKDIASIVPPWMPWHLFWTYFVGACFIAAPLSMVTRIQARLSASLLALTFFLFVALMDAPAWVQTPHDRFALTLALRELSFSGGALALAASLTAQLAERGREQLARLFGTIARYFIAVPVLFYSLEQFRHADHVPGIPLELVTPAWIPGHAIWTYLAAVVYAVAGAFLLVGKKPRAAASWLGYTVLFLMFVVYLPMAVVYHGRLDYGFNYPADTLMYCGALLLLAGAMPREGLRREETVGQPVSQIAARNATS